jgi:outer membrane lipoprotein-sorting protein
MIGATERRGGRSTQNTLNTQSKNVSLRFLRVLRAIVLGSILCAGCGARLMKLPAGPGAPAPDASTAAAEATRACRAVSTITAEIAGSGSIGGRRFRVRLTAGLAPPASARLEAAAPFGAPLFILVATGDDATLLLPHDGRVLEHGRPAAVLEALAGLPLDAAELRRALVGCPSAPDTAGATQIGDDWRVVADGPNQVYLRRDRQASAWRLVAIVHRPSTGAGWRAEYKDFESGLPRSVRFIGSAPDSFDVRLALSQVETNTRLGPDVFQVRVPSDADPITLDELRRARPGVRQD